MTSITLADLQVSVQDKLAFTRLDDYLRIALAFLNLLDEIQLTRIISPSHHNYVFFQYGEDYGHNITRPLNANLFFESPSAFKDAFERFAAFLTELKRYEQAVDTQERKKGYIESREINRVVYTLQQSIGCIGDSFANQNQSRKRVGQLFEKLVELIISEVGLDCEPRTIILPIPGYPGYTMSYELGRYSG